MPIKRSFGWCDDIKSKNYNQFIKFPFNHKAEKLYRNGDYSSAQNIFISQLNKTEKNDFVIYRIAECSRRIGNNDAIYWYYELLNNYENSNYYQKSKLDLSYIYFSEKKYLSSLKLLSSISQKELMTDEYFFKYGYSLFCLEKYDDAKYNFLKVGEGKYKTLSKYFCRKSILDTHKR